MNSDIREMILTELTVDVWPVAGRALGYHTKSAAHRAAQRGYIHTIAPGRRRPVPTAWLRKVLCLDNEPRRRRQRA
jgi:hypothetical protein